MKILFLLLIPCLVFGASVPRWIEKTPSDSVVLANGTEDTAASGYGVWTKSYDSLVYDYNGYNGGRSVQLRSTSSVTQTLAKKSFSPALNLTDKRYVSIVFKMEDSCKTNSVDGRDLIVYLLSDLSNYKTYYISTKDKVYTRDRWHCINFSIDLPSGGLGSFNPGSISRLWVGVINKNGYGTVRMSIGRVTAKSSILSTGYFAITVDDGKATVLSHARPVFNRYNVKPTLFIIPKRVATSGYMTWSDIDTLYRYGYEVGNHSLSHKHMRDISTRDSVLIEIKEAHDTLQSRGYKHRRLFAHPYGERDRRVDTTGTEYTDVRRATAGPFTTTGVSGRTHVNLPMGSFKYTGHGGLTQGTGADTTWTRYKSLIDSCVSQKIVTGILFHNFADTTSLAVMDTSDLDTMLHYLDSLKTEGMIDFGGMGGLFTFAPESCIVNKSKSFIRSKDLQIIDSISTDADSMRIVLYDSTGSGWDSIAGTAMLPGGSICTLTVSDLSIGTHTLREWGVANSGTIDSGLAVYTLIKSPPAIDSIAVSSTFLKGSFVIAADKTAELNGTAATVSVQTDSTAVVVGRLRNNLQDTISLFAGSAESDVKVNYKYKESKLTWKTK